MGGMRFVSTPSDSSEPVDPDDLRACLSGFPVAIAVRFGSAGSDDEHALSGSISESSWTLQSMWTARVCSTASRLP